MVTVSPERHCIPFMTTADMRSNVGPIVHNWARIETVCCTCFLTLLYLLTYSTCRVLLEKLTGSQSRDSPDCMESEGSLPHSQVLTTCPYPDPDQSSPFPHPISLRSILLLPSHLRLCLPSGLFPTVIVTKTLYTLLPSPYVLQAPPTSFFSI